jgi:Flp pilus assembly protein TadD
MMRRLAPSLIVLLLAIATGCDGGDDSTTQQPPTTTTSETGAAALQRAVRRTLRENDRLSSYVLWSNRIPAWATRSTRGPALAALRRSATDRRMRGIRVRTLANRLEITSIELDPSYTAATAVVRSIQRVRPYEGRKPSRRAVKLDERARVELRRLGASGRFVVWKVRVLG